jgi:hypothetical protein
MIRAWSWLGRFRLRDSPREVDVTWREWRRFRQMDRRFGDRIAERRGAMSAERARCAAIARARRDATIGQHLDAYGVADAIARQIEEPMS